MKLREIYSQNTQSPVVSFEIFPPKNDEDGAKLEKLLGHLNVLKAYNPAFISLTYGAGGTTQTNSLEIIRRIQSELQLKIMPHFTCVNTSKSNVESYLNDIQKMGIENILALRGDIPQGMTQENFDFKYANELVEFIKTKTNLSIGVAGYPEGHVDCEDMAVDLKYLKKKIEAGADAVFTQMFFDNSKYFSYVEKIRAMGIDLPVIPGVLPIMSYSQLDRMLSMARVTLPERMMDKLEKFKDSPDDIKKIGIEFATEQCAELISQGVAGLHFYTLNTSSSVEPILKNLGL